MSFIFGSGAFAKTFYISTVPTGNGSGHDPYNKAVISKLWTDFIPLPNEDGEAIVRFDPGTYVLNQGIPRQTTANARIALLGAHPCRSANPTILKFADNLHSDPA